MGLGFLTAEFLESHSLTPHSVGLFWASEQLVTEDATYAIQNKHEGRISRFLMEFAQASPASQLSQTHNLDRATTGTGHY